MMGERRSRAGGAGVSGNRSTAWMGFVSTSDSLGGGALDGGLSLDRGRLLGFLAISSLSSPLLLILAGEVSGSVFAFSIIIVSRSGRMKV